MEIDESKSVRDGTWDFLLSCPQADYTLHRLARARTNFPHGSGWRASLHIQGSRLMIGRFSARDHQRDVVLLLAAAELFHGIHNGLKQGRRGQ